LLAVIVGTVFGTDELGAVITGYTDLDEEMFCGECVMDTLYKRCVEDKAVAQGALFSRRLELRGNRDLISCSVCPQNPPRGHWCYVKCGRRRRLTFTDERTERFLVEKELLQQAAQNCYEANAENPRLACWALREISRSQFEAVGILCGSLNAACCM
jgi:hypothetical protein